MSDQQNPQQVSIAFTPDLEAMDRKIEELKTETTASVRKKRTPMSEEAKAARREKKLKAQRREARAVRRAAFTRRVTSPPLIVCLVVVGALSAVAGINANPTPIIEPVSVAIEIEPVNETIVIREDPPIVKPVATESIKNQATVKDAFDALPPPPASPEVPAAKKGDKKQKRSSIADGAMQLASIAPITSDPPTDDVQFELPAVPRGEGEPDPLQALASARGYLVETSTPGGTMARQGPELAIERLHPEFVLRLSDAIKEARIRGLPCAGVFSAYRPPAFGVGGFRDKSASLHAYGLAVDMKCVGRPGSGDARHWHQIARRHGVVCPYGPNNRAEWNHCQPTNLKMVVRGNPLRNTITASGPVDLERMWNAAKALIVRVASAAS